MNVILITLNNLFPLNYPYTNKRELVKGIASFACGKATLDQLSFLVNLLIKGKRLSVFFLPFFIVFFLLFYIYKYYFLLFLIIQGQAKIPILCGFRRVLLGVIPRFIGTIRTRLIDIMFFLSNQKSIKLGVFFRFADTLYTLIYFNIL